MIEQLFGLRKSTTKIFKVTKDKRKKSNKRHFSRIKTKTKTKNHKRVSTKARANY